MSDEETASSTLNRDAAKRAWRKIAETGAATREAARLLQVGLREYLDLFSRKYLGDDGAGGTFKLILGANGEGKTHLLYCLRERALATGHVVALLDAKSAGAAQSPFVFARQVLQNLETPELTTSGEVVESDENSLLRLGFCVGFPKGGRRETSSFRGIQATLGPGDPCQIRLRSQLGPSGS